MSDYVQGLQTAVRANATAFGFSIMITSTLAALSAVVGSPTVGQLFLFLGGAVAGMVTIEAVASGGFRERMRGEPPEAVVLGSALSFISVTAAVGAGTLVAELLDGGVAWTASPFAASLVYPLLVAGEMALGERAAPQSSKR